MSNTIAQDIQALYNARGSIFDAIAAKGVTVPSGSKLADCATLIASISSGFSADSMIDIVPAQKIAVIDSNGYIGFDLTNYFCWQDPVPYFGSAILVSGADYSQSGLGQLTILALVSNTIGGKTYRTVSAGGHTWLAENLDYIWPGLTMNTTTGDESSNPIGHYTNHDEATWGWNGRRCGILYNRAAVNYLEANKATLFPGWHVPTSAEFNDLYNKAGSGGKSSKLKATDNFVPYGNPTWPTGWNGTNTSGFSALPAGYYIGSNTWRDVGNKSYFWVISSDGTAKSFNKSDEYMSSTQYTNQCSMAVRLIKDY